MLSLARRALVEDRGDRIASAERLGRRAWLLRLERDGPVVLLETDGADKHRREVAAYRAWAPSGFAVAPTLLASSAPAQAILLSYVRGRPTSTPPRADDLEAAGRALAGLHACPHVDDDPVPLCDALLARARAVRAEVDRREGAPPVDLDRATAALFDADLDGARRVPCHRDYMPYNWRWTPDGRFSVLDFEHARPDLWLVDVARLAPVLWSVDGGWAAFWRGYGREPDGAARLLGGLAALDVARTWAWGQRHPEADDAARILGGVDTAGAVARLLSWRRPG